MLAAAAIALLPLAWAAALVVACIALILMVLEPLVGVLLIVVSIPFGSLLRIPIASLEASGTDLLVWYVVAVWGMRLVVRREVWFRLTALGGAIAVLLVVMLFSLLGASSVEHGAKELVKWSEVLALYLLVSHELDPRKLRLLAAVTLLTGGLAAVQGIYQFAFRIGPEAFVLFGRFMRAYGTFGQPNPYAGYLGLILPIGMGLFVGSLTDRALVARGRWILLSATATTCMLAAIGMSWSRGAWLGLLGALVAMAVAALARTRRRLLFVAGVALIVAGGLMVGGLALGRSSIALRVSDLVPFLSVKDVRGIEVTDANFSVLERMAHWQAALGMWADHQWLGVGIGNYEVAYPAYSLPMWDESLGHAHNYYLNMGAEAGLAGFLAFILVSMLAVATAWRACRRATGWCLGLAAGILGATVHLCVHNLFDDLFVHAIYLEVAILLGMVSYLGRGTRCRDSAHGGW
jgi:putative inorganic carbon (hco3(-)) transporter